MKDSQKYSKKVVAFFKKHRSKRALKPLQNDDKVETLVYSVLYEHLTSDNVDICGRLLSEHFVDWNDLRVCRQEEILDVLAVVKIPDATRKKVALQLIKSLNCVFDKYDRISFEDIDELGKRQANQELEKLSEFTPFMVDFLMLNFKASHSLPLNEMMLNYVKDNGLVDSESDEQDIKSFLLRQVNVNDVYEFYSILRQQAELSGEQGSVKPISKPAAKKAATKKTTAKKVAKGKPAAKKAVKKTTKKATKKVAKKAVKKTVKKAVVKKKATKKAKKS